MLTLTLALALALAVMGVSSFVHIIIIMTGRVIITVGTTAAVMVIILWDVNVGTFAKLHFALFVGYFSVVATATVAVAVLATAAACVNITRIIVSRR